MAGAKLFRVPIYGSSLVICPTIESAQKRYSPEDMSTASQAYVTTMEMGGYLEHVIVFRDIRSESANTIAHEALHAAWRILDEVGVTVDKPNHEALAYLLGWVVDQIESMR